MEWELLKYMRWGGVLPDDVSGLFKRTKFYNFGFFPQSNPLNYIHPYKSRMLEKLLTQVPETVEMIIVYGSSVQDYQREDSDLDLAVIPYDPDYKLSKSVKELAFPFEVDIKMFRSLDDLAEQARDLFPTAVDILNEGVLVYCSGRKVEMMDV
jgi:predicted nucleotidyltransferase